ncbi:MAG TPA: tyrosine-type recombinase/integrase [Candidatus Binatia bacterium]|jgi:site-specific recombinase XerD|nr:tyrosine-type recombinase/integrase [Candidatus Binatia bacterium]
MKKKSWSIETLVRREPWNRGDPLTVYIDSLRSEGSKATILGQLRRVARFLTDDRFDAESVDWAALRYLHVEGIRAHLQKTVSPATGRLAMSALKGVLRRVWKLGYTSAEEFMRSTDVAPIKGQSAAAGRSLSLGELAGLFRAIASDPSPAGRRDAALLGVLYSGGLRRDEAAQLDLRDFDAKTGELRVHGKGARERIVHIEADGARDYISAWLKLLCAKSGPLFVPIGKSGSLQIRRMSPEAIYKILRKRASEAGIERFSPHDLRRSVAGDMLDAGVDISVVQRHLGHSSVTTTTRYDRRGTAAQKKAARLVNVPYVPPERRKK